MSASPSLPPKRSRPEVLRRQIDSALDALSRETDERMREKIKGDLAKKSAELQRLEKRA